MLMKYYLALPYEIFVSELELLYEEGKKMAEDENQEANISRFGVVWEERIVNLLTESIKPEPKPFIRIFQNSISSIYEEISMPKYDEFGGVYRLESRLEKLLYILDVFSIIQWFRDSEKKLITTVQDKKDFILSKLYTLFDSDRFYSVEHILKFNDIRFREKEPIELIEDLSKKGYITKQREHYDDSDVKLTVKGASYVERKIKSQNTKTSKLKRESSLDKKLDEIATKLRALGYGQEILFNELEELRELQTTLSKKTWTQVLKGKLFDMGVEQVINMATASMIYEFLTNDQLKLM